MKNTSNPTCPYREAWEKVKGLKGAFWGGLLCFLLICFIGGALVGATLFVVKLLLAASPTLMTSLPLSILGFTFFLSLGMLIVWFVSYVLQGILEVFIFLPIRMGLPLISLRRVADKTVKVSNVFKLLQWEYIWRFMMVEFFMMIFVGIPMGASIGVLCIAHNLPYFLMITGYVVGIILLFLGVYIAVCFTFANLIVIDRKLGPWEALDLSLKTISKDWWCVFGAYLYCILLTIVATLLLLVGLIWVIPYTQNIFTVLYKNKLGIEGKDPITVEEA